MKVHEANSHKIWVDAICVNCNKRFKTMRAVSMHLKGTANRHAVNFMNRGKYDKKTGLKERSRSESNLPHSPLGILRGDLGAVKGDLGKLRLGDCPKPSPTYWIC